MSRNAAVLCLRRILTTSLVILFLLVLSNCGGSSSSPSTPPPTNPTLTSVTVAPSNSTLILGVARQFTATANYSDQTTRDVTASATWSTTTASVATVSSTSGRQGVVTPRGVGSSTLTATYNSVSGNTTAVVKALVPRFILAGNCDHTVSRFTVNSASGTFRAYGYTPVDAPCPFSLAVDPLSKFVYLASDFAPNSVWAFSTDPQSGTLTAVPGSPFAAGPAPTKLAIDAGGKFLFVTNRRDGSVSVFSIGANGALSAVAANVPSGQAAWAPAVDPLGKFLYVTNALDNTVSAFSMASSGALTPVTGSPYATGAGPMGIVMDPSGQFLYVTNNSSSNISAFTINGTTGALSPVSGSPFTVGQGPGAVAIDPSGKFLMVANGTDNTASVFSIDTTTGALTAVGEPIATDEYPIGLAFDPSGKFGWVSHLNTNDLGSFAFNSSTGAITPAALMSVRTGPGPLAFINASPQLNNPTQYEDRNLYVADVGYPYGSSTLSALKIDPNTGGLTGTVSAYNTGGSPATAVATNLQGTLVYSANLWTNNIGGFTVDPKTSALTTIAGSPFTASNPYGIGIDPSSRFFYAADYSTGLRGYSIDPATGSLTELSGSPFATGFGPIALSIDPAGRLLYVLNSASASISGYSLDPLTGIPTPLSLSPYIATTATGYPRFMVIDATGRYLYVVVTSDFRGDSYNLLAYAIDAKTGALTPLSSSPITTGKNPVAVVADPTGRWLYVGADAVYGYGVAPDGSLTAVPGSPGTIGDPPLYLVFEASGKYLYAGNDKGITGFTVDPTTGALTAGPSFPFPSGKGAWALTSTFDLQ
jgi:6-phosphogluconolactonase (cycloisomerase 2 family)